MGTLTIQILAPGYATAEEEHSEMLLVQRHANRDLTPAEVEAMHLRKTRKKAIRDRLREAHER